MISGPDIITYIGVPLAVLGVLPIIYNTISTLATLAKVRRLLRHGKIAGIARGDVINHVIEIELPRYTIAPLHRHEQYKDYWRLCDYPSQIPGGSWTLFNWKSHVIGLKTQRIDYSDQLRLPQAEIDFEELVSFLLDLGAVPDEAGFRMLRGSGLWVPRGTPLLVSPNKHEKVLEIGSLEDSDGHLSLSLQWSSNWGMRDQNSLPPYWVLLKGPPPPRPSSKSERLEEKLEASTGDSPEDVEEKPPKTAKYTPPSIAAKSPPCIRCQVGVNGLTAAIPDEFDPQMFESLPIQHLQVDESISNTGMWFASVVTAFSTSSQTILWNYKIPTEVLAFAKKDTIPCGVLVMLDIIDETKTPEWATKYNDEAEARAASFASMKATSRALMLEASLPPAQKAAAARERQMKSHDDWIEALNARQRRDIQRAEIRIVEALQSPKWRNSLIAQHCFAYLQAQGKIDPSHDLRRCVEVLLWRFVNDVVFAEKMGRILDQWKAFVDNGGIRKADWLALKEDVVGFAEASLLVAIIEDSVTATHGTLASDLQECLRIWKTVRLG